MVKDHLDSDRGNRLLSPHGLLFSISSEKKWSLIYFTMSSVVKLKANKKKELNWISVGPLGMNILSLF